MYNQAKTEVENGILEVRQMQDDLALFSDRLFTRVNKL